MPIYEYTCGKCNKRFEIFQKITDKQKKSCTECGGKLTKMISRAAFQLKGSGWYATDYAKKSPDTKEKNLNPEANAGCEKPTCKPAQACSSE